MSGPLLAALGLLAVFAVLGCALTGWAILTVLRARRSDRWPSVDARVVRSERGTDADGDTVPSVEVAYRVDGRDLRAADPWFGTSPVGDASTAEILRRFPAGAIVPLRYDPERPACATLLPGRRAGAALAGGIGLVFVLVSTGTAALLLA